MVVEKHQIANIKKQTMKNPKILVPLDFSDAGNYAMKAAKKLAELFEGRITPLHSYMPVSELYSPGMYGLETMSAPATDPGEMEKMHEENLRETVGNELGDDLIDDYIITMGKPDQAIVEAANDFDLIVMGSHGRSGFSRFFMGSVSDKVLRTAHIPVLIVNEKQQLGSIERIMVTTDFSDYSKEAFPVAKEIAEKTGAQVELIHVLNFNARDKKAPDEAIEHLRRQRLNVLIKENFHELNDRIKPRLIISSDSPHEAIMNDNLNNPHDLIVMAAVGRTGIEHLMMGGTASHVVRYVKSPVLSVNPKVKPRDKND